jgi:hypothetical protein
MTAFTVGAKKGQSAPDIVPVPSRLLGHNPHGVNHAGHIKEQTENDVDEQIFAHALFQQHGYRR